MDWRGIPDRTAETAGGWEAQGATWRYELLPYVPAIDPGLDSWIMRVVRNGSDEYRYLGAYQTLNGAQQWAERFEKDPNAYFKVRDYNQEDGD